MSYPKHRYAVTRVCSICYMSNLLHSIAIGKNIPLRQQKKMLKHSWRVKHQIRQTSQTCHNLRSFLFILEEIEHSLWRDWEPNGGGCTEHHAIRLARVCALMHSDSDSDLIHPTTRECGPSVPSWCTNACTTIGDHPLCKFHHASLALRWGNHWKKI